MLRLTQLEEILILLSCKHACCVPFSIFVLSCKHACCFPFSIFVYQLMCLTKGQLMFKSFNLFHYFSNDILVWIISECEAVL